MFCYVHNYVFVNSSTSSASLLLSSELENLLITEIPSDWEHLSDCDDLHIGESEGPDLPNSGSSEVVIDDLHIGGSEVSSDDLNIGGSEVSSDDLHIGESEGQSSEAFDDLQFRESEDYQSHSIDDSYSDVSFSCISYTVVIKLCRT